MLLSDKIVGQHPDARNNVVSIAFGAPAFCDEEGRKKVEELVNPETFLGVVLPGDPVPRLLNVEGLWTGNLVKHFIKVLLPSTALLSTHNGVLLLITTCCLLAIA